jgi:hypothetical protein
VKKVIAAVLLGAGVRAQQPPAAQTAPDIRFDVADVIKMPPTSPRR